MKGFYELSRLVDLNFTGIVNNVSIGLEPYGMVAAISQLQRAKELFLVHFDCVNISLASDAGISALQGV